MISIVIPLYNKENYILETVQSVLNQTYINFELLIVNDGSTDDSLSIVQSIQDNRIKIINLPNGGVCKARNTGISQAKSEWIAFLDADDWWDKNFLAEMVQTIKEYPSEKVFATGRSRIFKQNVKRYNNPYLPKFETTKTIDYIKVISKYLPPINSSNSIINKNVLQKAGLFNIEQKLHEDHDLWLRICCTNQVVFINKNLSFYRKDIVGSSSQGIYASQDFMQYLQTIKSVKEKLSNDRLDFFKKYYNRFILLTFIKFEGKYSKDDKRNVYQKASDVCDVFYSFTLKIINILPSGLTYSLLKKIKK